jgi:hypothetical protein
MSDVSRRIQVLTGSLRCFVLGCVSLVPLLGLPFGAWAVVLFWRTSSRSAGCPNPAQGYLWAGVVLAVLGLLLGGLAFLVLSVVIYQALAGSVF